MRQIVQDLSSGETRLAEIPAPRAQSGQLLIRTRRTLVSAGTERMLVDFGRAGLINKARQQPDKVREAAQKVRTDGLLTTVEAVRSKLDQPLPLGYCNVGTVVEVGAGVTGFSVGDRVACNGGHAEYVSVPRNLCAPVPEPVADDAAAFTVIGAIALQGVRLAQPTLGECFVVTGLGLVGQMAVQLLRAHGCRVLGVDFDDSKLALARQQGAETVNPAKGEDPVAAAQRFSRGRGVDGVLLTLAAKSSEPVAQAARMCRKRGRVILVGVTGLELNRADFFEKELTFQVSCSYGPGRYDPVYEQQGQDYPYGFVRWTEQRNFEAVLDMMADGRLDVSALITHRYDFDRAPEAYDLLVSGEPSLGIVMAYPEPADGAAAPARTVALQERPVAAAGRTPAVSFIGAGNYAGRILIPAFKAAGAELSSVVTANGLSGAHYGRKHGFRQASTDTDDVLASGDDAVVVATRHDTHADLVVRALEAGKHVFVEKPLALGHDEVDRVEAALRGAPDRLLTVGFNRRFAPHVRRIRDLIRPLDEPKAFVMTVNAGTVPADHWTQDPKVGGGRIVGEACHFIDLLRDLAGHPIAGWHVASMGGVAGVAPGDDRATITLEFADGSFGTIHYLANGHKSVPKERLEVFAAGRVLQLDNFRKLTGHGWPGFRKMKLWRQDKGQTACAQAFLEAVRDGGAAPIPRDQLLEVARLSLRIAEAARG